jgi:formamidopyrimidine-DNA glycosylase
MPELPEVETIVRCLRPHLIGLTAESIELRCAKLLRNRSSSVLQRIRGKRMIGLNRRGKLIRLDLSGGLTLLFHLKMTGQLLFCRRDAPHDKHTHFVVSFEKAKKELRFRDVRKFGFVLLLKTREAERTAEIRGLGPEPLGLDFPSFLGVLQGRRGRVKSLLLNQGFIAGIGNIYADEILFEARIHPATEVSLLRQKDRERLWKAIPLILARAIKHRGTSIRDFRDGDGLEGGFQDFLCVYGRELLPCPRCGAAIKRLRIGGRSSFFCPRCQRPPSRRRQSV